MGGFLAELRRRRIYRVGAVYVVVAWGVTQVIDVFSQIYALPDWIAQPISLVLAIGLPIILIATWMIVGAANETGGSADRLKTTATDWVLASALIAVLGLLGYQQFAPRTSEIALTTGQENPSAANVADETVEAVSNRLSNSVAVLPFENVSPDPDDAYFTLGIHEEILNKLNRLRNVSVIGRTSANQYEGSDKTVPEIADELNVEMVAEGSVRYAGNQVRVSVQLIDGETNLPVWVDQYDGELADVFGIQAEIAMNITNSLQAELSMAEREAIQASPTDSPEAYALYLRALEVWRSATTADHGARIIIQSLLDEALELDPEFALAYLTKADAYGAERTFSPVEEEDWLEFSSELSRRRIDNLETALSLDPSLGAAHAGLAILHLEKWQWELAQLEAEQALRLSPNDSAVLLLYSQIERDVRARPEEALLYAERAIERDPNNSFLYRNLAWGFQLGGRYAEAVEAYQKSIALAPVNAGNRRDLSVPEFNLGHNEEALETLRALEQIARPDSPNASAWLAYGYGLLGQSDDAQRAFEALQRIAEDDYTDPGLWAAAYMGVGDYEEALNRFNEIVEDLELIRRNVFADMIRLNIWNDPKLDEPEWVEARERLTAGAR